MPIGCLFSQMDPGDDEIVLLVKIDSLLTKISLRVEAEAHA